MSPKILIFLTVVFVMRTSGALSETIELKNGKEIVGEIIQETEDAVVISKQNGGFIYSISRDRIKTIRDSGPGETEMDISFKKKDAYVVDKGEEKTRREELEKYRLEKYKQEVLAAKKARGRIKIKFSKDRFGVVNVLLNKKVNASLLVDTGASHVVISEKIATQLGIRDLESRPTVHAMLADGSITTGFSVTLDSVKVGDSEAKDVKATVSKTSPGAGLDGLLGMTFLGNFHVKMDRKDNSLILEKY